MRRKADMGTELAEQVLADSGLDVAAAINVALKKRYEKDLIRIFPGVTSWILVRAVPMMRHGFVFSQTRDDAAVLTHPDGRVMTYDTRYSRWTPDDA